MNLRTARARRSARLVGRAVVFPSTSVSQAPILADVIRVEVRGLRNDKGQIICALFSSAQDFPKHGDKAVAHIKATISHGLSVCEFPGIAIGRYAVSVFHD